MKYLILSGGSWEDYEYKRLLELLPNREGVCFAGRMTSEQQTNNQIRAVAAADIYSLNMKQYTILVSSPYWLTEVLSLQAAYVVALLERCPEEEKKWLWDKYSGLLGAKADLVATRSERIYLEQSLRREGVLYLGGDQQESYGATFQGDRLYFLTDYEVLWRKAIVNLWQDSTISPANWFTIQLELRADYYISMCAKLPSQPVVHYLAASYLYLLGDPVANRYLTQSFELMVLYEYLDCLHSHFRFFSAIEGKTGDLETAVQQYTITAFTAEEKRDAERLRGWLHSGQYELVRAELFRLNEDEAAAVRILSSLTTSEAKLLLIQNYIRTFQWEKALELQQDLEGSVDGVIEGTIHLLHGRRHEAIRSFLNAAGQDNQAWPLLSEMADLEEAVKRLKRRVEG
ncbi:hypothetical protein NSQ90_25485 [Paenibacillus sp. FSL H7-0737]|uniref:hypothetical protein n=1 Tax=Paenibacillus sp. FSL H7-0737 TaxID=1536775 RepID=UPI0004F78A7D|nr:hypothetical protein [Paenibacillus sp. FSL H7-0737]AIQ25953.1 hypothetical protein H70737_25730 [Paenibacillus sp. FSL H7-0737]